MMKTFRELILNHNNDYRPFFQNPDLNSTISVSVIIPYYCTGRNIKNIIRNVYKSLEYSKVHFKNLKYEIIIVDDGSPINKLEEFINKESYNDLKIIKLNKNQGRAKARNIGIKQSSYKYLFFLDSDILLPLNAICSHLTTVVGLEKSNKKCITLSLFEYSDLNDKRLTKERLLVKSIKTNDWRTSCKYTKEWIGCSNDLNFIDKSYCLLNQTNNFSTWKGNIGPWILPNIVLGGFFTAIRSDVIEVGMFNKEFTKYAFEEIALATKLIALKKYFVVPILEAPCIHISDDQVNLSHEVKMKYFRKNHKKFFNVFLNTYVK